MNIELFRDYCITKTGVTEEFPFGPDTLVFKVGGKIFAITDLESFESINLKCDPRLAVELRERYINVIPGYHMNKKHWNTVIIDELLDDRLVFQWIDHSYDLVFRGLPEKVKENLK